VGAGCIAFTPLAQGLLTSKYLNGIPADARINRPGGESLPAAHLNEQNLARIRGLAAIAADAPEPGATGAGVALRDPRMTSLLIGASSAEQVRENVRALDRLALSADELRAIGEFAVDAGINLWEKPATDQRV